MRAPGRDALPLHNLDALRQLDAPYVVILGTRVIGHGKTPEAALESAGPDAKVNGAIVIHVPREGETYLF